MDGALALAISNIGTAFVTLTATVLVQRKKAEKEVPEEVNREEVRVQERTLSIVGMIKSALEEGNRAHIAELHTVRMAIEQAGTALLRVADRVDTHHTATIPAIGLIAEVHADVKQIKATVERRKRA